MDLLDLGGDEELPPAAETATAPSAGGHNALHYTEEYHLEQSTHRLLRRWPLS